MMNERMAAGSSPIFPIPTVSVVAIFLLVFLAVLCICFRKRDSNMSHTYEEPVAMASEASNSVELASPYEYDTLQRGPVLRKQTAPSPTSSTGDKNAKEGANHNYINVYNEIAIPGVALKESEKGSEAYQHLQRPLGKRPEAGATFPEIANKGYARVFIEGSGASSQTDPDTHQAQGFQGPNISHSDHVHYTLEIPAEANVPDDDDPGYDLSGAFM